jgi:dCTP deaminase
MTVLSCHALRVIRPVEPFVERTVHNGMSYGVSYAGYDVRISQDTFLPPGGFALASTIERFDTPNDVVAFVHDKSTWARRGISLFNTVIEPGWRGFLTLEITNVSGLPVDIRAGDPIAQIIYQRLDNGVRGYTGKYQDQPDRPVEAINEH